MGFLQGKKALVTGVASERSIATGIAEAMRREGAELAFTYQGDKLKSRVEEFAHEQGSDIVLPLDVTRDAEISAVFDTLKSKWDGIDIVIQNAAARITRDTPQADQVAGFVDTNNHGTLRVIEAFVPLLRDHARFQPSVQLDQNFVQSMEPSQFLP